MAPPIYVLDTTALIARWLLYTPVKAYTTPLVVAEAKDPDSREGVETATALGRLQVAEAPVEAAQAVRREAVRQGLQVSLSEADLSVAALAWHMKRLGHEVIVVTDDYALQNLLAALGIRFQPLRTRGIREKRSYIVRCPACGYVSRDPDEKMCPRCGTPLRRYLRRRRRATK